MDELDFPLPTTHKTSTTHATSTTHKTSTILLGQQYSNLPVFQILANHIEFKCAKKSHVLEVLVGVLEDSGGS